MLKTELKEKNKILFLMNATAIISFFVSLKLVFSNHPLWQIGVVATSLFIAFAIYLNKKQNP